MNCEINSYAYEILKGLDDIHALAPNEYSKSLISDIEKKNNVIINRGNALNTQLMEIKMKDGILVKVFNHKNEVTFRIIDTNEGIEDGKVEKALDILVAFKDWKGISKISVDYMKTTSRFLMDDKVEISSICSIVQDATCAYFCEDGKPRKTINAEKCNVMNYLSIIMNCIKKSNNGDLWKMFKDGLQVIYPGLKVSIEDFLKNWMNILDKTIAVVQNKIAKQENDLLMNKLYMQVLEGIKESFEEPKAVVKEKISK